jgi:heme A synthase
LARLLLHRREDRNVRQSMREWLVLVAGLAMMLVWAGIMEAFFSQSHAPVLPYGFKVAVAAAELLLLTLYLVLIGRREISAEARSGIPSEKR